MPNMLAHTLCSGFPLQRRPVFLGYVMLSVSFPPWSEFGPVCVLPGRLEKHHEASGSQMTIGSSSK